MAGVAQVNIGKVFEPGGRLVEVVIDKPTRDFATEARIAFEQAQTYHIVDQDSYAAAADDLRRVKALYRAVDDERKRITTPLDQAKRAAQDHFRPALSFLEQAETVLKGCMAKYAAAEREKRLQAERLALEAARREQDKLEKRAERAETQGKVEQAEALREQASMVGAVAPVVVPPAKTEGITLRTRWDFRIVDANALPREYLMPDEKKIAGVVRAMKAETRIAGVEVLEVQDVAARRL